jgi:hypothetical protein
MTIKHFLKSTFSLAMLGLASAAVADSFTIIRDGKDYLCQETSPQDPGAIVDCADMAYKGPFNREQATQLCAGATSTAPAQCGIRAYQGPFNIEQSLTLCKRSRTTGPADCAASAYAGPFNQAQSIRLCARDGSLAHADCAKKAYAGPYTLDQAVDLCRSHPGLVSKSLDLLLSSPAMMNQIKLNKSFDKLDQ